MTTKENRKNLRARLLVAAMISICLFAVSCSDVTDGDALPDGKYPMTFTAQVDGLTATRATADNTWNGAEEVAIQIGSEVKKYTAANGGSLTIAENGTPFYWQTTSDITVNAWYPYNSGNKPTAAELRVKANQSEGNNYQESDYLEAVNATVTFANKQLAFKHRTAKVVVTLKAGDFVSDLTDAAVTFVNQTGVEGNSTEVTPKTETTNGAITYSALLIPQSMQGKQFIKVAVGDKNYYYTPKGMENGDLRAGYVDNYTITVKQNGLSVVWQKGEQIDDTAEEAIFKVHLADFSKPANTIDYAVTAANGEPVTASNGVYTLAGNELNISLSAAENYRLKTFLTKVTAGICKQKVSYAADTRTYTYTFHDIRSDLWLDGIQAEAEAASTSLPSPQTGDYYYWDGTWSSTLAKPCIGIVFKVGAGQDDQVSDYSSLTDNTIHGYAVALNDAHTAAGAWGIRGTDVNGIENNGSAGNKYDGYKNTTVVRQLPAYNPTDVSQPTANGQYWAFKVASEYAVVVPDNTSGWYLPSIRQLADINGLSDLASRLAAAGGAGFKNARYWSSTEKDSYNAWYYQFGGSGADAYAKSNDGGDYLRASYVRTILTF